MALQNLQQYGSQTGNKLKEKYAIFVQHYDTVLFLKKTNMRQVQPETLRKNSNLSSCLQNIKLKINTT
jgi:hypothetical protein